jgi:hypothetical protein
MKHKDLAKKAGFHIASSNYDDIGWVWCSDGYPIDEELERFAELVRADEREACALLVEGYHPDSFFMGQVQDAANLIRARSDK